MSELTRLGRVKLETEFVDLAYRLTEAKAGEKSYRVGIIEFSLKRPVAPGPEAKELVKIFKAFVKEFMPDHEITVVSGRGPIWFYGMIAHELVHVTKALAFFDPKLEGAVLIATHYYDIPLEPGDIIKLKTEEVKELTQ